MKKFLIKLYVSLFIKHRKIKWPKQKTIEKEFNKTMDDFSDRINEFPYKHDPLWGLIDYTDSPENFFNENKKEGRDCDDWARMWSIWGVIHGFEATEWIICDAKHFFGTMHVFTILRKYNKFYLMNYRCYGPFRTEEEAKKFLLSFIQYRECKTIMVKSITLKENK